MVRKVRNVLPVSLIVGAIAGLLVGGYFNVINVPVMEWAISLEEAAAGDAGAEAGGIYAFLGSLGMQRVGLVAGLAVLGVLFGAIFTGLYHLVRRAAPGWNMWAWAVIAGLLGFWAVSLFTQIKYPLNPPGIGEDVSLLGRQGFQFLFAVLSLVSVAAGCLAVRFIHESGVTDKQRLLGYSGVGLIYAVAALIIVYAIPGNPDPIPQWVPESLIILFRTFSILGHLLLWMLIALGVAGYIRYRERGINAYPQGAEAAGDFTPAGRRT